MIVLDGKEVSKSVRTEIRTRVQNLTKTLGRPPGLGVILVGSDPASHVYVANKEKGCHEVGMYSEKIEMPGTCTESEIRAKLDQFHENPKIDGILVQLPLPQHIKTQNILSHLWAKKDADALTAENLGLLWAGRPRVVPCTPNGVMMILKHYGISVKGKTAVVVGRSQIVGKPMAHLLTEADATVTVCHSKTPDIRSFTSQADIVVVAAGRRHLLGKSDFKQGAVVIDVGMHRENGKLAGDVRYDELQNWAAAATPVPGGVGPMTITSLLLNTLHLAESKIG